MLCSCNYRYAFTFRTLLARILCCVPVITVMNLFSVHCGHAFCVVSLSLQVWICYFSFIAGMHFVLCSCNYRHAFSSFRLVLLKVRKVPENLLSFYEVQMKQPRWPDYLLFGNPCAVWTSSFIHYVMTLNHSNACAFTWINRIFVTWGIIIVPPSAQSCCVTFL